MNGWHFDDTRFVEEVLKPVQDGWRSEDDLFRVYQLSPDVSDDRVIRAALDDVRSLFTSPRFRAFQRACNLLRTQHQAATAVLTDTGERSAHRQQVIERTGKLAASLRQRLQGAPGLPSAEVRSFAMGSKGAFTRTTIRAALAEIGARELDPVDLPDFPEPGRWTEIRGLLAQLRHDSLFAYLRTVLAGSTTSVAKVQARRERLRVSRGEDSVAETTVLKLLEQWITTASLIDVLRYEALAWLAGAVHFGYAEVARNATCIADRLPKLGLPTNADALAYAVWCRHRIGSTDREPDWYDDYRAAVRDLQLRRALTVLDAQPKLTDEWRTQQKALGTQLSILDEELTRCAAQASSDVEAAVAGYLRIREQLADPGIDAAIARCRPAEPRSATAEVRDGRVVVSWQPSTATAGRIGYRVSRGEVVVREHTDSFEVVDEDAPGGTPLAYAIHTVREGTPSARPARTATVTVLPDVLELELHGEPNAVTGRWRLPAGATGVVVTRDGHPVRTQSTSFVDRNVQPGRSYGYLVRASYRLADAEVGYSTGRHAIASSQEIPTPVTDLVAELDGNEVLVHWTPPQRGEVEVLELRPGADPPDSEVTSIAAARKHGGAVPSTGLRERDRLRGWLDTPGRRQVLLPITVLGELAAIGTPFVLDARHSAVRSLRLQRLGDTVRLSWEWPAGATAARVAWRTGAKPSGAMDPMATVEDVTRVTYESRGVSVRVPPGDHWFGVCTAISDGTGQSFGPLVLKRESTTDTVHYSIEGFRLPRRGRRILVLHAQPGVALPPVVLTAKTGVRPMSPDDGLQLLRTDRGGAALRVEFTVPRHLARPVHLRAFSGDDGVVLVPARPHQLVLT